MMRVLGPVPGGSNCHLVSRSVHKCPRVSSISTKCPQVSTNGSKCRGTSATGPPRTSSPLNNGLVPCSALGVGAGASSTVSEAPSGGWQTQETTGHSHVPLGQPVPQAHEGQVCQTRSVFRRCCPYCTSASRARLTWFEHGACSCTVCIHRLPLMPLWTPPPSLTTTPLSTLRPQMVEGKPTEHL